MELGHLGKVVGITGAASQTGIGFAIASSFLKEGARVFICDINVNELNDAVKQLSKSGEARAYCTNVANEREVADMFEKAENEFGSINVFVNNAGIYPQVALNDMDGAMWDQVMSVNLKSVFLCGCEAQRRMRKGGGGVILNAASFASLIPSAGSGGYAASKAAVYSLTKTMAAEFAPYGIRVNGFIPGVIETGMTKSVVEERRSDLEHQIALNRLGTPQDVANVALFLCSDAASYVTGAFLEVSGGKLCVQNPDYGYKHMSRNDAYGE